MKRWLSTIVFVTWLLLPSLSVPQAPFRQFDAGKMEAYKEDPAFNYTGEQADSGSWMALLLASLAAKLASLWDMLGVQWMTPIFFRLILLAGIILAVFLLVRVKYGAVLTKKAKNLEHTVIAYPAGEKQDYEKLLHETLRGKQFKLAVRYLFLTALGTLEQQRNIKIAKWKAPYDYLKELPEEKRTVFRQLTDLFENTWYGDYQPDNQAVVQGLQWYHQLENA